MTEADMEGETVQNSAASHSGTRERLSRDDILDVAIKEFAMHGYRGTNLGQVSEALGVTRQAIYYYFPKKHDVLTALFMRFFDRLEATVDAALNSSQSPGERFGAMLAAHLQVVAADPALSSLFTEGRGSLPPGPAEQVAERRHLYNERFVTAYRAGVKSGELNGDISPSIAANLLIGAANWVFRWYDPSGRMTPLQLAAAAQKFLAAGYTT